MDTAIEDVDTLIEQLMNEGMTLEEATSQVKVANSLFTIMVKLLYTNNVK